jgi:hypothetical protein
VGRLYPLLSNGYVFFGFTSRLYKWYRTRVEAGSNTSAVAQRVVGGDGKECLESETVQYGHESHGTRIRE